MQINLKQLKLLPFVACVLLILRTAVSFNVFAFLLPVSYAVWGGCILCFFCMLFLCSREMQITKLELSVLIYFLLLCVITLLNGTDMKGAVYNTIEVLLLLMLFNYYRHRLPFLIKTLAFIYSVVLYINLAMMIIFPTWMFHAKDVNDSFLLGGNYNAMGCRMICGIVTSVLCVKFSRLWLINTIALFIVSLLTLLLVGSMTSLSNIVIFTFLCLIPSLRLKKLALLSFFVFYLLFQFIVVFSGEGIQHNETAVYIIEEILHKDITFTNRTYLWDAAGKLFASSPLIGYGCVDNDWYLINLSSMAIGPHNFILAVLINGGLLLISAFLYICVVVIRRVLPYFDNMACLLLMGIVTLLFMMTMEVYPTFFIIYLLTLVYFYPNLCDNDTSKIETETAIQVTET